MTSNEKQMEEYYRILASNDYTEISKLIESEFPNPIDGYRILLESVLDRLKYAEKRLKYFEDKEKEYFQTSLLNIKAKFKAKWGEGIGENDT